MAVIQMCINNIVMTRSFFLPLFNEYNEYITDFLFEFSLFGMKPND